MTTCRSAPVVLMTMSARTSSLFNSFQGAGRPFHSVANAWARSKSRLRTTICFAPASVEVLQRFLGHLAGADDEHALVVESFEDSRGEVGDRDAGDADAMAVERRFAGDAAGECGWRLGKRRA